MVCGISQFHKLNETNLAEHYIISTISLSLRKSSIKQTWQNKSLDGITPGKSDCLGMEEPLPTKILTAEDVSEENFRPFGQVRWKWFPLGLDCCTMMPTVVTLVNLDYSWLPAWKTAKNSMRATHNWICPKVSQGERNSLHMLATNRNPINWNLVLILRRRRKGRMKFCECTSMRPF